MRVLWKYPPCSLRLRVRLHTLYFSHTLLWWDILGVVLAVGALLVWRWWYDTFILRFLPLWSKIPKSTISQLMQYWADPQPKKLKDKIQKSNKIYLTSHIHTTSNCTLLSHNSGRIEKELRCLSPNSLTEKETLRNQKEATIFLLWNGLIIEIQKQISTSSLESLSDIDYSLFHKTTNFFFLNYKICN